MQFVTEARAILVAIVLPTAFGNALEYLPVTFGLSMVGHQPGLTEKQIALEFHDRFSHAHNRAAVERFLRRCGHARSGERGAGRAPSGEQGAGRG